jgi:hypothetical protein
MVENTHDNPESPDGLSAKQLEVLQHIRLFRITTQPVTRKMCFGDDATTTAIDSFLTRLRKRELVQASQLAGTEKYYYLTRQAYQAVFNEVMANNRVGSYAVVEWFGRLLFCARNPDARKKLHWSDFDRLFPQLHDTTQPRRHVFYVDKETDVARLGMIYVDPGNRFDRVVKRIRTELVGKLLARAAWREHVIDGGRLTVAVVCTDELRATQLRNELDAESHWPRIRFCFEGFRELLPVVLRRHAESNRGKRAKEEGT